MVNAYYYYYLLKMLTYGVKLAILICGCLGLDLPSSYHFLPLLIIAQCCYGTETTIKVKYNSVLSFRSTLLKLELFLTIYRPTVAWERMECVCVHVGV